MSRPPKDPEPRQLVAIVPKNRREGVSITIAGTNEDWHIELQDVLTFPDAKRVAKPHSFRLKPGMLRAVSTALKAVADATDAPAMGLPTPEELAADIAAAPLHLKALCAVVGTGRATFLVAHPGDTAFRVFANGPTVLLVDDAKAGGPGNFDVVCLAVALKRAGLVVLTVGDRIAEHYHCAAGRALDGIHSVIIETTEAQALNWMAFLAVETPEMVVLSPKAEATIEPTGAVH